MDEREREMVSGLAEWARTRLAMAAAYLAWLAETARLPDGVVAELEETYPGLGDYAARGRALARCGPKEVHALAARPSLVLNESPEALAKAVGTLSASDGLGRAEIEAHLLMAWLGGRRAPTRSQTGSQSQPSDAPGPAHNRHPR